MFSMKGRGLGRDKKIKTRCVYSVQMCNRIMLWISHVGTVARYDNYKENRGIVGKIYQL